jgi:hypothetical protein
MAQPYVYPSAWHHEPHVHLAPGKRNFSTYSRHSGYLLAITILILYNINSRLVPFLKFIYASVQISDIFVFIISFRNLRTRHAVVTRDPPNMA